MARAREIIEAEVRAGPRKGKVRLIELHPDEWPQKQREGMEVTGWYAIEHSGLGTGVDSPYSATPLVYLKEKDGSEWTSMQMVFRSNNPEFIRELKQLLRTHKVPYTLEKRENEVVINVFPGPVTVEERKKMLELYAKAIERWHEYHKDTHPSLLRRLLRRLLKR